MTRPGFALAGVAALWAGSAPLHPFISAHLGDPAVHVGARTLLSYGREVLLQTDAVGPGATAAAWLGVALLVLAVAWPAGQRARWSA